MCDKLEKEKKKIEEFSVLGASENRGYMLRDGVY